MRAAVAALLLVTCSAPRASDDAGPTSDAATAATAPSNAASAPPSVATDAAKTAPAREDMILVPAGAFVMGTDTGGEPDERPAHEVTLPAFFLDANLVTNADYDACVKASVCAPPDDASAARNHLGADARFRGPRQPVSAVSWFDAQTYCAWKGKRLPREAELEKAARDSDARKYPWGNDPPTHDRAVFASPLSVTEDVGTHPKGDGPYGHHDLAGNVWEWTSDVYDPYAYRRPNASRGEAGTCEEALAAFTELRIKGAKGFTGTNPIPKECERVLRGGAFNYPPSGLRSTNRVHHPPRFKIIMAGLRCAQDDQRRSLAPLPPPSP